jgi:hypothetical protein
MKKQKILRELRNSNSAVVGIVVTVLIIGLFLVIMVMLNTTYIPQWLESSEAGHMEEVSQQFSQLKYALDIQSIAVDDTAMTTSVSLGMKEIPFFNKGRTSDTLEIIKDAITIEFSPGGSYTSDAIIFSSGNSYFVNQKYIYEAGALIINQDEKCIAYANPTIIVSDYMNFNNTWPDIDGANITFFIPQINGLTGKTNVGGYGIYPIYTTTNSPSDESLYKNVKSITITNNYPDINVLSAWKSIFEITLKNQWIDYDIIESDNKIKLSFPEDDNYNFNIGTKNIITQIAFGLAE